MADASFNAAKKNGLATNGNSEPMDSTGATTECADPYVSDPALGDAKYPFQIKVGLLPESFSSTEFQRFIAFTFKVWVPRIYKPTSSGLFFIYLCFDLEKDRQDLMNVFPGHIYKSRALRAVLWDPFSKVECDSQGELTEEELEKLKEEVSFGEIVLNDALPLLNVPYEYQKVLTRQDAELMSRRLHGLLCERNPALVGWAEKTIEDNGGTLVSIDDVRECPTPIGYRNKAKFRIGRNEKGEIAVGFGLLHDDLKITGVAPGDRMVHLPDNMKHAAKRFSELVVQIKEEPYNKQTKAGLFDCLMVRVTPVGSLKLVVVVSHKEKTEEEMKKVKEAIYEFFVNGPGNDCNIFSLYFQVMQLATPIYPREKLDLLAGSATYEETICGLKFNVSPFSIMNVAPSSSENIYTSVIELVQPTPDTVIIDLCAGSGGIAFTLAPLVSKAYCIEPNEDTVIDAEKTMALNKITNVEIIQGKCEEHLESVFAKEMDSPLVVVIDPPRHGVVKKILSQIRAQANVSKIVYVCSNTKTGIRNFLDLAHPEGPDKSNNAIEYTGLPFLPTRCIPLDCAPYTANTCVPMLLERIDPSAYPEPKNPPPEVIMPEEPLRPKRPPRKRQDKQKGSLKGVRGGGVQNRNSRNEPPRSKPGRSRYQDSYRAPPRRFSDRYDRYDRAEPYSNYSRRNDYKVNSLLSRYEQRIAELEKRENAYQAGLQAGLQASMGGMMGMGMGAMGGMGVSGSGSSQTPRSMGDYGSADAFGGYRGGYRDPYGGQQYAQANQAWSQYYSGDVDFTKDTSYGSQNTSSTAYPLPAGSRFKTTPPLPPSPPKRGGAGGGPMRRNAGANQGQVGQAGKTRGSVRGRGALGGSM